jgi:thiol-disulfide isomerase/thioredoxin
MDTITSSKYSKIGGRRQRTRNKRLKPRRTLKKKTKTGSLVAYGKIYADWCGHCVALKPEWAKLERVMMPIRATNIESANKDHLVDVFNRKYNTNLPKEVGFPTIFKLSKYGGKVEIYNGERNADNMIAWLKNKHLSSEKKKTKMNFFGLF